MKPRVLQTTKLLAVALLATAGCAPTTPAASATSGPSPEPASSDPTIAVAMPPPNTAPPQAPAAAPSAPEAATPAPPRPRPESNDPALLALSEELYATKRSSAMAQPARFRPLCDQDGYPLVGNLNRKSASPGYQPSAFCGELRQPAVR